MTLGGSKDYVPAAAEDAKYMLVSCSAFVNYLVEKWGKITQQSTKTEVIVHD